MRIDSAQTAFLAGLVTSLHCAAMCGPLACAIMPSKTEDALVQQSVYHVSRVFSYTLLGVVGGFIGAVPLSLLGDKALWVLPWALVVFFAMSAFGIDRLLPKAGWAGMLFHRASACIRKFPPLGVAAGFGLLTPLLPCGPLYAVLALSTFTGTPLRGAEFMFAFGAGTIPFLWLAQNRFGWLQAKFSPESISRVRLFLSLIAAAILTWRLRASFGLPGPTLDSFLCS
jgi:sulfite exporter TauE/SafE